MAQTKFRGERKGTAKTLVPYSEVLGVERASESTSKELSRPAGDLFVVHDAARS